MAVANPGMTTTFDSKVTPLTLPVELTGGAVPEALVMDGIVRGQAIIGRLRGNQTLLGLKFDNAGQSVRVELALSADDATWDWWVARVPEDAQDSPAQLPRLVAVRAGSKARLVGATVVTRLPEDAHGPTRAVISFDLDAAELDSDGLLIIEVEGLGLGRPDLHEVQPALGLRIDSVRIEAHDPNAPAPATQVSGGNTAKARTRGGWLSIIPGTGQTQVDLELVDAPLQLTRLASINRYGKYAARVARKGTSKGRRHLRQVVAKAGSATPVLDGLEMEVLDLAGNPITDGVTVSVPSGGRLRLQVADHVGEPILVRLTTSPEGMRSAGFLGRGEWSVVGVR